MKPAYYYSLFLAFIMITTAGCSESSARTLSSTQSEAEAGEMIVSGGLQEKSAALNGEWKLYWNQFIDPSSPDEVGYDRLVFVPGRWSDGQDEPYGYGTFRLKARLDQERDGLGLYLRGISTSYQVWINGDLLGGNGIVGTEASQEMPSRKDVLLRIPSPASELDIIIYVANFTDPRGGIKESIKLGDYETLQAEIVRTASLDMFLVGGLFIIGLYHFGLYAARQRNRTSLYFSLFCIVISIRSLVVGKTSLYMFIPDLYWEAALRIEYFTIPIGLLTFALFARTLFPNEFSKAVLAGIVILSGVYALLIATASAELIRILLPHYQLVLMAATCYCAFVFLTAAFRRREGAGITVLAALFLMGTVLNDVMFSRGVIVTGYYLPVGLLIYVLANSFMLGLSFSKAYASSERLAANLQVLNNTLEQRVAERTMDLEELNKELRSQSLLDGLTGIANRRAFDAEARRLLDDAEREGADSCLLLLDIDFFKRYNDHYGHLAGDDCLKQVAALLDQTASEHGALAFRYGGEEFAVLLRGDACSAQALAASIVERVREKRLPHAASDRYGQITISCGLSAISSDKQVTLDSLIEAADAALYQAKLSGRNCWMS